MRSFWLSVPAVVLVGACVVLMGSKLRPGTVGPIERAHNFVASRGELIYYETAGRGEAVVLCHGAGGNHIAWYQQVPVFARSYQVITWDQRGFGRSTSKAEAAGPAEAVNDLRAILDALGIHRAHLIGQSMGGWAALGFAVAYPERVRSLVLADTIGGIYTPEIRKAVDAYLAQAAATPNPESLPLGQHPALHDSLLRRDPARAFLYQELSLLNAAPALGGVLQKNTSYAPEALAALRCPVLFVVGSHDRIFPPPMIREAAALVPHARVVEIPGAGHSPYFEKPEAWNGIVLPFLRAAG